MTPADRFALWLSCRQNQNIILVLLAIYACVLLWMAGDYSPIEMVRSN